MRTKKIDTLLIIRGLLAVSVVVWHIVADTGAIPAMISIPGRTAVWFFFGISGYVISYGFFTERYKLTGPDIRTFYMNRLLRIYPLFLLLSLLTVSTQFFFTGTTVVTWSDIPAQFLMLQFNHEYLLSGVFWTLGVEMHFYLIAPLLMWLIMRKANYSFMAGMYILLVLWVPFSFYAWGAGFDGRNVIANLSHFFIGIIGCRLVLDQKQLKRNTNLLIASILMILVLTNYLYAYAIKFYWTGGSVLIDLAILAAIFLHANLAEKPVNEKDRVLAFFTLLGVISYGIYAWHPYLIQYIPFIGRNVVIAIVITTAIAYLSYRLVEQPILRLKKYPLKKRIE